jgi:predicted NAD/FAD-dependent oxidoreductase
MSDVVVIGAGMSGIACARALQAEGVAVRLIDKGRGIGGRIATRRTAVAGNTITFDHGVQYLDQSEGAAAIAELGKGAVDAWHLGDGTSRTVGTPGMAALPKALANGLNVTLNTRVTTVRMVFVRLRQTLVKRRPHMWSSQFRHLNLHLFWVRHTRSFSRLHMLSCVLA